MVKGRAAGVQRERAMTARSNSFNDYAALALILGLAAVFIYAGVEKMGDSLQFADSIAAFGILPAAFISLLALSLPPFEIACGLLLLWRPTRRVGALAIALISVVFFSALLSALARGLTLDCGCFGIGAPSRPSASQPRSSSAGVLLWIVIGLALGTIVAALAILLQ